MKLRVNIYGKEDGSTRLQRSVQNKFSVSLRSILQHLSFSMALDFPSPLSSLLDPTCWLASSAKKTSTFSATVDFLAFFKEAFSIETGESAPLSLLHVDTAESLRAWTHVVGRRLASSLLSCRHMSSKSTSSSLLEKAKWVAAEPGLKFLLENPEKLSEVGVMFSKWALIVPIFYRPYQ